MKWILILMLWDWDFNKTETPLGIFTDRLKCEQVRLVLLDRDYPQARAVWAQCRPLQGQ